MFKVSFEYVCLFVRSSVCCLLKQKPYFSFSDVIVNKATTGSERNDCVLIQNWRLVMF